MSSPRRHLVRSEDGIALAVALAVLAITLLLALAAVAVATNTSILTNSDTHSKAAIAAADAGARTAVYRLSAFHPNSGYCPTPTTTTVGSNGLCASQTGTLGNGAQFTYWVSDALTESDSSGCTGSWMTSGLGTLQQRCLTVLGTANGVNAVVQERVAAYTTWAAFPTAIFGTKSVTIDNNVDIISDVTGDHALIGTNGYLNAASSGGGITVIDGYQLPPGATVNEGQNVTNTGPTTGIDAPYPVPTAVNPGYTWMNTSSPYDTSTTFQDGTCLEPTGYGSTWEQTNCNYRINCPDILSCDPHSGNVTFDAVHRILYLGNNSSLVLGGGYYNFCGLYLSNNSVITIAPGAQTSIYIDSASDPSSGTTGSSTNPPCPTSTTDGVTPGTFTMNQNSTLNAGGSALNANIYVFGDPTDDPPTNAVNLQNNGSSSFTLQAPYSNVSVSPSNNSIFKGAIVGYTVTLGNKSHFTYEADTQAVQNNTVGTYYRSYWEQCPATGFSSSSPTSTC
jgi:hypothetical protein